MAIAESTLTVKLTWTIFMLMWISIPFYWIEILFLFVFYYLVSIFIDVCAGFLAARKRKKVLSRSFTDWLLNKWFILMYILFLCLFSVVVVKVLWDYSIEINNNKLHIAALVWLVPHFFIVWFSLWENISTLEKMSVIFSWTKSWVIFKSMNFLANKFFNSSIEYIQENIEKKIDNKFEKDLQK